MIDNLANRLSAFLMRSVEKDDEFALAVISGFYPLTPEQLQRYSSKLRWSTVAINKNILWSRELYNNFKELIPLCSLSANEKFPWTEKFIEANFEELFYYQGETTNLSINEALPWSIDFIEKYKEHWEWYWLSFNSGIPFTKELINRFKDYWDYKALVRNNRILADEELRKYFKQSPPSEHECIFCYKDRFFVIEQRKFSLKLMTDCPNFRWDRKLLERIKLATAVGKLHSSCVAYFETSFVFNWNIDAFEIFEELIDYNMLSINDSATNYIVDIIKKFDLLDTLLEKLPTIDFDSREYTISLSTPDENDNIKLGLN